MEKLGRLRRLYLRDGLTLSEIARRPKRDRRSALKLHAELKAAGFPGDYSRVTEFVRRWRENGGEALVKAFVPLKCEPGEAFQFDWSEGHLVIGGVWRKVMAAHLKPCASRAFVLQGALSISTPMLRDPPGQKGRIRSAGHQSPTFS